MDHTITLVTTSADRDAEPDVVYRDAAGRSVTFPWHGEVLLCGALATWDQPPVPMSAAERERVLDHLAAWAFGGGSTPSRGIAWLAGPERVPLRLPRPFGLRIHARGHVDARSGIVYMEPGRCLTVLGDERSRAGGRPRLSIYLDKAMPWQPSGAIATPAELAAIVAALPSFADVEVTAFPSRRECDVWSLARELEECGRSFVGVGAEAGTVAAVCQGSCAPPPGWFWQVELPCIYEAGRTGWNLRGERFSIGPIAWSAMEVLRARWQATPPAPTLLLRAPEKPGAAELLVLADGNLRFFTLSRALVLLPGQDPELTALAHEAVALAERLAAAAPAPIPGDATSDLLLTADGARALPPSPELRQRGHRLLAGLLDHVAPLG